MASEYQVENQVVFGIFRNRANLEQAVDRLRMEGIRNSDVSALMPSTDSTDIFTAEKSTKAPEGATAGVVAGFAIGGALGWLASIGSLAVPGVGPFIAAGPIVAALAGAGVGGGVIGVAGALVGAGIPEYEAKRYEASLKEGGMLLSVHVNSQDKIEEVKEIFLATGARDITSTTEEKASTANFKRTINSKPYPMGANKNAS